MPEELIVVYVAAGQVEANLVKSLLEAEGIPAMVAQEGAGSAFGLTVGPMGRAEILVPASRAEEARELLAGMKGGESNDQGTAGSLQ